MRISTAIFITVSLCLLSACGDEDTDLDPWSTDDCASSYHPDCWQSNGLYCSSPELDLDEDGYCGEYDCNEEDPLIHTMAMETPDDGIDQNCDGEDWSTELPESLNP